MAARLQAILAHLAGVTPIGHASDSYAAHLMAVGYAASVKGNTQPTEDDPRITERFLRRAIDELEAAGRAPQDFTNAVLRSAYHKAVRGAHVIEGFTKKHPCWSTVIALALLAIIYPAALKVLGFGVEGIAKASYAAAWQSTYGAAVPVRSLFAYLQHLGATIPV